MDNLQQSARELRRSVSGLTRTVSQLETDQAARRATPHRRIALIESERRCEVVKSSVSRVLVALALVALGVGVAVVALG